MVREDGTKWAGRYGDYREAQAACRAIEAKYGSVHTDIEDEQPWWDAEEYHQKYFDKEE